MEATVKELRKAMSVALEDPGLRETYLANIAMCVYDNRRKDGRYNMYNCNVVAERLIRLIFDK